MSDDVTTPPLGVERLASFLERTIASRDGRARVPHDPVEWQCDVTLLSALGLNLKEALEHVFSTTPSLDALERWILDANGGRLEAARIARLNAALAGTLDTSVSPSAERVLDEAALASFAEHGYVVVHDAISADACAATVAAIETFLGVDLADPSSWTRALGPTIWVPLLHHPAVEANRHAPRVRAAFEQLWGRSDLWPVIDQVGFNPPETSSWRFPGPHLHWDVSLAPPVPFGLQGILYLTDTAAEQGAFTCVPGFHRRLDAWVASLPRGASPRDQDLTKLGAVPIAGEAGDLVVWHQALPHGSRPNRASRPRVVQYLTLRPTQWDERADWL